MGVVHLFEANRHHKYSSNYSETLGEQLRLRRRRGHPCWQQEVQVQGVALLLLVQDERLRAHRGRNWYLFLRLDQGWDLSHQGAHVHSLVHALINAIRLSRAVLPTNFATIKTILTTIHPAKFDPIQPAKFDPVHPAFLSTKQSAFLILPAKLTTVQNAKCKFLNPPTNPPTSPPTTPRTPP